MNTPESYRELMRTLKNAIDPAGILSPGRYEAAVRGQIRPANANQSS